MSENILTFPHTFGEEGAEQATGENILTFPHTFGEGGAEEASAEVLTTTTRLNEAGGTASSALEPTTSTATSTLLSPIVAITVGATADTTSATATTNIAFRDDVVVNGFGNILSTEPGLNETGGTASSALEPTISTATSTLLSPNIQSVADTTADITLASATLNVASDNIIEGVYADTLTVNTTLSTGTISASADVELNYVEVTPEPTYPFTQYDASSTDSSYSYAYSSSDNALVKFDDSGNTVWQSQLDIDPVDNISVDFGGNTYLISDDDAIVSYDSGGGKRWEQSVSFHSDILDVDDEGNLYFADSFGRVKQADSTTGEYTTDDETEQFDGDPIGIVSDGGEQSELYDGAFLTTDEVFGYMRNGSQLWDLDLYDLTGLSTDEDISNPVREPGTQYVTFYAEQSWSDEGDLIRVDGDKFPGEKDNTHENFGTVNTDVDLKTDDDGAIYAILEDGDDSILRKYSWDSGIHWERTVTHNVTSLDVTNVGNVYVRYEDGGSEVVEKYSTDTGSHIETLGDTDVTILAVFPDTPSCSDAWGKVSYGGTTVRSVSAISSTLQPAGALANVASTDGVSGVSSPTTVSATPTISGTAGGATVISSPATPTTTSSTSTTSSITSRSSSTPTATGVRTTTATSEVVGAHSELLDVLIGRRGVSNIISSITTPTTPDTKIKVGVENIGTITSSASLIPPSVVPGGVATTTGTTAITETTSPTTTSTSGALSLTTTALSSTDTTTGTKRRNGISNVVTSSSSLFNAKLIDAIRSEIISVSTTLKEPLTHTKTSTEGVSTGTLYTTPLPPSVSTNSGATGSIVGVEPAILVGSINSELSVKAQLYTHVATLNTGWKNNPRRGTLGSASNVVEMIGGSNSVEISQISHSDCADQ